MNIVLGLDSTVSLLENIQLFLIVFVLIIYGMGAPKKIVLAALYLMAILHIVFIISYAKAYGLKLVIRPFLDIFIQTSTERASAMIDAAQIIITIIIIDYVLSILRRRKESQVTNITPTSNQELYQ